MYKAQELQVSGNVGVIAEGTIATFDHNSGMWLVEKKNAYAQVLQVYV